MERLQKLRDLLTSLPEINCGGCAIAALAMYRYAKRVAPDLNVHLVYFYQYNSESYYEINRKYLKGEYPNCTSCSHAVIEVDGKYYDCEKEILPENYKYYHYVTEDFLIESLKEIDDWCTWFSRENNVPRIEKFLGEELPIELATRRLSYMDKKKYQLKTFFKRLR